VQDEISQRLLNQVSKEILQTVITKGDQNWVMSKDEVERLVVRIEAMPGIVFRADRMYEQFLSKKSGNGKTGDVGTTMTLSDALAIAEHFRNYREVRDEDRIVQLAPTSLLLEDEFRNQQQEKRMAAAARDTGSRTNGR